MNTKYFSIDRFGSGHHYQPFNRANKLIPTRTPSHSLWNWQLRQGCCNKPWQYLLEIEAGFSLLEILCACPIYWRMTPEAAMGHIDDTLAVAFPPGVYRDWEAQ